MVLMEGQYLRTGEQVYHKMARFYTKIFALIFGIGVGYLRPELEALGANLADRGVRTDEYLAAIKAIWSADAPSFDGRFVNFHDVMQRPLPVQRPHPPVVVGGSSVPAYRRAILSANGFYGSNYDLARTAAVLAEIRQLAASSERPAELGELEITVTPSESIDLDLARRYADLGVHRLLLQPRNLNGPEMEQLIDTVGSTLVGRV